MIGRKVVWTHSFPEMLWLKVTLMMLSVLCIPVTSVYNNDAIVLESPTSAAAAANLPPLIRSVWDHPLVEVIKVPLLNGLGNQKTTWKCLAPGCDKECSGANSLKALAHGSRDNKYCLQIHVKECKGAASQAEIDFQSPHFTIIYQLRLAHIGGIIPQARSTWAAVTWCGHIHMHIHGI